MSRSRRSLARALVAAASLSLAACRPRTEGICVESLCFSLPLTTSVRRETARHTLRPDGASGWINVQRFVPFERPDSTEPNELARLLGRRFALASAYNVLSTSTAPMLGRQVATLDARITVGDRAVRRRSWLIDAEGDTPWLLVDITAPETEFERAIEQLQPIVRNVARRAP